MGSYWIGQGNREDLTPPVRHLRATGQKVGLLRKNKNRLLPPSRLARSLTTDGDHVSAVAARLLEGRHDFLRGALALFALMTAASGHVAQWSSPVRHALERAEHGDAEEAVEVQARHAAILARAAL